MTICTRNHDEVCFEGWDCPMCELLEQHDQTLSDLQESYQLQVDSLTDVCDYYKDIVTMYHPEHLIQVSYDFRTNTSQFLLKELI